MAAIAIWWNSKSPIFRFLSAFIALMLVFYIFYYSPIYENYLMNSILRIQAKLSNGILNILGYDTESNEDIIAGIDFRVSIKNGCDGIEATALYVFAILAFPFVSLKQKTKGLISGVLTLSILNLFRIAGLYIAGVHWKVGFEFLHLHGGVIIFTLIAILLWLIWLSQIKKYVVQ
ncbi:MAG: archaeosortase/exosortase family protein [Saprospiraceae bacterium]|nr:archaeosortase/exosortase family protein [Saprospiraceae bacterium]MBK8451631.1 archaeosortase/exosortase family protein [Saprospiraceae bacterium]MBK8486063.1 archaeosortase/exosortase family protein [Saprospiraceae bacterium]MBK9221106.1 archaeosortase/exosortase family protein [Saprospiraceae bacterium]MBK9722042.1 archaeosortase/exosortase family protein [Saprospiraceae bacterium]